MPPTRDLLSRGTPMDCASCSCCDPLSPELVEGLPREQLEALAGSLVTEILLAQGLGCSEIPLKNLEQMMGMAGVCTKCEMH